MSAITLLKWARGLIELAAQRAAYPPPPRLGPQIIRNTCLVRWLNAGMPVGEVLARAGLKSVKGLYHLRDHLGPGVSLSVARGAEVVGERASRQWVKVILHDFGKAFLQKSRSHTGPPGGPVVLAWSVGAPASASGRRGRKRAWDGRGFIPGEGLRNAASAARRPGWPV
jgi:hypothetical protein